MRDEEATVERVCRALKPDQQLITLFSENYVSVNCRSSLEGVWNFAYQNRFKFTGECNHPDAQIRSCQSAGSQFLITNQKFNITYKKCEGMSGTFDGSEFLENLCCVVLSDCGVNCWQLWSTVAWGIGLLGKIIISLLLIQRNREKMRSIVVF